MTSSLLYYVVTYVCYIYCSFCKSSSVMNVHGVNSTVKKVSVSVQKSFTMVVCVYKLTFKCSPFPPLIKDVHGMKGTLIDGTIILQRIIQFFSVVYFNYICLLLFYLQFSYLFKIHRMQFVRKKF